MPKNTTFTIKRFVSRCRDLAVVTQGLRQPFLRHSDATLYLGGYCRVGSHVEAVWTNGTAMATTFWLSSDNESRVNVGFKLYIFF
jgi:hypothetical protein